MIALSSPVFWRTDYQAVIPDLELPIARPAAAPSAQHVEQHSIPEPGPPVNASQVPSPLTDRYPLLVQLLEGLDTDRQLPALKLLETLLHNLLQHPTEFKFQRINLASQAVVKRFPTPEHREQLQQLLQTAGFEADSDGSHLCFAQPTLEAAVNLHAAVVAMGAS